MVRAGDTATRSVHDLKGKRLCAVAGSNSWKRVTQALNIAAVLAPGASYSACVAMLLDRRTDAVSTDDLILAGFAARAGPAVRIVNEPFSYERYGIGIRKGDLSGCEAVNRAVSQMYLDGTAVALLEVVRQDQAAARHARAPIRGLRITTTVHAGPVSPEGCGDRGPGDPAVWQ